MSVLNWIRFNLHDFYRIFPFSMEELLAIALGMTIILSFFLIFQKTIRKYVSPHALTGVFCSSTLLFLLLRPRYWEVLDLSWIYGITPPIRIALPTRISSKFVGIPSLGTVDVWLIVWVVYLIGAIACDHVLSHRDRKMRKFIRKNAQPCPEALTERMRELMSGADSCDTQKCRIDLLYCNRLNSPCTVNLRHATIVLDRLDYEPEQLDLILRHELNHINAGHLEISCRLDILRSLLWFQPLIHIAVKQIRRDMEFAVDEMVISKPETTRAERITYARLLTDLAETRALSGAALYLTAGAELVQQRVSAILHPSRKAGSWLIAIAMMVLSLHVSLLITTGTSVNALLPNKTAMLACLGNNFGNLASVSDDFKHAVPLEGFRDGYRNFHSQDEGFKLLRTISDSVIPYSDGEIRLFAADAEEWRAALIDCLGEPISETEFDLSALESAVKTRLLWTTKTLYRGEWRITPVHPDNPRTQYSSVELVFTCREWEMHDDSMDCMLNVYVRLLRDA